MGIVVKKWPSGCNRHPNDAIPRSTTEEYSASWLWPLARLQLPSDPTGCPSLLIPHTKLHRNYKRLATWNSQLQLSPVSPAVPLRSAASLLGSRKRVKGSSKLASSLRIASYVWPLLAIGSFLRYVSRSCRQGRGARPTSRCKKAGLMFALSNWVCLSDGLQQLYLQESSHARR